MMQDKSIQNVIKQDLTPFLQVAQSLSMALFADLLFNLPVSRSDWL